MGLVILIGLLAMSRMGVQAHYCAGAFALARIVLGLVYGAPFFPLLVAAAIAFVFAFFWFKLLEAMEDSIIAYLAVMAVGVVAAFVLG